MRRGISLQLVFELCSVQDSSGGTGRQKSTGRRKERIKGLKNAVNSAELYTATQRYC